MKPRSLKSRALQLLSQRDQSRLELRRKLLRHARQAVAGDDPAAFEPTAVLAEVDALLVWLDGHGFLSDERFVESRVHARESRFGNLRIKRELAQHGVAPPPELAQALGASELERAQSVRDKRFAAAPETPAERAAQQRFLAGRGFSPDTIHKLMRHRG